MSGIRNKISSIEADDDVATRALGLRPIDESTPLERVAKKDDEAPMPAREANEPPPPKIRHKRVVGCSPRPSIGSI